jgi:hypothetical protein
MQIFKENYYIDEKNGTVVCVLVVRGKPFDCVERVKGIARLRPGDVWNEKTGKSVARQLAMMEGHKKFITETVDVIADMKKSLAKFEKILSEQKRHRELTRKKLNNICETIEKGPYKRAEQSEAV